MGAENKEGCRYLSLHSPLGAGIGPDTITVSSLDIEYIKYGNIKKKSDTTSNQAVKIIHLYNLRYWYCSHGITFINVDGLKVLLTIEYLSYKKIAFLYWFL